MRVLLMVRVIRQRYWRDLACNARLPNLDAAPSPADSADFLLRAAAQLPTA